MLWQTHLFVTAQAFANGFGPFFDQLSDPDFLHAVRMFSGACLTQRSQQLTTTGNHSACAGRRSAVSHAATAAVAAAT
jgi:hypothetical protein